MSLAAGLRGIQGISNTTQGVVDTLGRLGTGSFWAQLKPASFAGVQFGVFEGTARFGRRTVVHQYPFRDQPWVEDLGREGQRIELSGFLVGDDVIAQRDRLIEQCEKKGAAKLVHPTLGIKTVALIDFSATEHWDRGRVFEVSFAFIEQGKRLYPTTTEDGSNVIGAGASAADSASLAAFITSSYTALKTGAAAANEAAKQATAWSKVALQAGNDATSLVNLAVSLPGSFGRLLGQARGVSLGQLVPVRQTQTVRGLEGASSASRVKLSNAAASMQAAGANLGPNTAEQFGAAAQDLTAAISASAPTPGDALRALAQLAAFDAVESVPAGGALTLRLASIAAFRRAAAVEMTRAGAAYEPASGQDAASVRELVTGALDAAITVAGDSGDDEVYAALRSLRASAVRDLNTRGALLPTLRTVTVGRPMPALVLAQRLYRDPTRADDLVRRADPPHPAFMPLQFEALST